MIQLEVEVKTVDNQGRIILPKNWRDRYLKGKKAIVSFKEDLIEIRPFTKADLTTYFDKVDVDLKADLSDWHKVERNYEGLRMSVAYVDANVFVYAFLKTKRNLQPHEVNIKEAAKKIVSRINEGEKVATSVVHFSEVCNILDDYLPFEEAS